jgi:PRC-barrel domain
MIGFARLARGVLPLIAAAILSASVPGAGVAAGAEPPARQSTSSSVPDAAAPKPAPAAGVPSFGSSAAAPKPPANLEPLAAHADTGILGKKIMGPDGKDLGLVVDVLVDEEGRPQAAVIDFGGFLGVGSRKIAVDWRLLKLSPAEPDWKISLNLGRDEIQSAPEYKPDAATDMMVGPAKDAPSPDIDK